ncbi:MAG: alpha/beta fold hydrolase [Erythrobacter sp.]
MNGRVTAPDAASMSGKGRFRLALQRYKSDEPKPTLRRLLGEFDLLAEPVRRPFRELPITPSAGPKTVIMLPGFVASPLQMRYLSKQIERAGHTVKKWGMGFNFGASQERIDGLERRLAEVHQRYGQKIVLIGWSLGGIFAREMAHRQPNMVEKVITLGSPIAGDKRANNAWRAYQLVAGHAIDALPVDVNLDEKPPVETVAMWSQRDGVIPPHSAKGNPDLRDREIETSCTHIGFSYAPEAVLAILRELERN